MPLNYFLKYTLHLPCNYFTLTQRSRLMYAHLLNFLFLFFFFFGWVSAEKRTSRQFCTLPIKWMSKKGGWEKKTQKWKKIVYYWFGMKIFMLKTFQPFIFVNSYLMTCGGLLYQGHKAKYFLNWSLI